MIRNLKLENPWQKIFWSSQTINYKTFSGSCTR